VAADINRTVARYVPERTVPWHRVAEDDKTRYRRAVDQLECQNLREWEEAVRDAAMQLKPQHKHKSEPKEVQDARAAILRAPDRRSWSMARRRLWRVLRSVRRSNKYRQMVEDARRGRRAHNKLEVSYLELPTTDTHTEQVLDKTIWPGIIQPHIYSTFGGGTSELEQRTWLTLAAHQTRAQQKEGLTGRVHIEQRHVDAALSRCDEHKTSGPNGLGYAHFKHLSAETRAQLAKWFTHRANDHERAVDWGDGDSSEPWAHVVLSFVPKTRSRILGEMRALASTDCLQKIYLKSLMCALSESASIKYPSWQFGFVPGRQCADMLFLLQSALLRASEWGVPVVMCKVDISRAFDGIRYDRMWRALCTRGMPAEYAFAFFRELVGCRAHGRVGCTITTQETLLEKGGRQGSPETPMLWNLFLWDVFAPMLQKWTQEGWHFDPESWMIAAGRPSGYTKDQRPEPLHIVAWADDIVLVAHDLATVQHQLDDVVRTLKSEGLTLKTGKIEVLAGRWAATGYVAVGEDVIGARRQMTCLGAVLRSDGTMASHLEHVLAEATGRFRQKAKLFRCRHLSLRQRFFEWMRLITPMVLWAMEVFPPSAAAAQRLDSLQLRHLVYMMGKRANPRDVAAEWQSRFRHARQLLLKWGANQLSHLARVRYYKWAGHAARHCDQGWRMHCWRNEDWWRRHMSNTPGHSSERRAAPGHQVRWDRVLVDTLGVDWHARAADREVWRNDMSTWLQCVSRARNSGFVQGLGLY
jgi:hypothetical protein